jgi:hypothetical protein
MLIPNRTWAISQADLPFTKEPAVAIYANLAKPAGVEDHHGISMWFWSKHIDQSPKIHENQWLPSGNFHIAMEN